MERLAITVEAEARAILVECYLDPRTTRRARHSEYFLTRRVLAEECDNVISFVIEDAISV